MSAMLKSGFFPKAESFRENRRQKTGVSAGLTDTPVKITLEA
jgi:hypothetical protein